MTEPKSYFNESGNFIKKSVNSASKKKKYFFKL